MIRGAIKEFDNIYNINVNDYKQVTPKTAKITCEDDKCFFVKETNLLTNEKYRFLFDQGINSVLYPIKNNNGLYTTIRNVDSFYVLPFIPTNYILEEVKANSLTQELQDLHNSTSFKRQLSPQFSRKKMEDIYEYLEYKFNVMELFVRSIESRKFDEYSIVILKNYNVFLDAKKDLARLQKKIISDIKSRKSVNMAFIHNNPKLDHLLMSGGARYFVSLEKSKIGVPSLDIAKFYIENEDLNIDMRGLILTYFSQYDDDFYFDYFCFLVLFYYIKGLKIVDKDYVSSQGFINTADSIKKFKSLFIISDTKDNDKSK